MRERIDRERANDVLAKEASLNSRLISSDFKPVVQKALNIEGAPVKKAGQ